MNKRTLLAAALAAGAIALPLTLITSEARADLVIKQPDRHPQYRVELEPHLNLQLWHRDYGFGHYKGFSDTEFGAGFRASIEIADPAFIPKLNNTVAITFGVDFTNCHYSYYCN